MVKNKIKKMVFGPVEEDEVNLDYPNIEIHDVSFSPSSFREEGREYNCSDDYMVVY